MIQGTAYTSDSQLELFGLQRSETHDARHGSRSNIVDEQQRAAHKGRNTNTQ